MGMQNGKQNSVLIASYIFPPLGGIGAQRPLKFVKYLNEFGWKVNVLTVNDAYSATLDPSLLNEVPEYVNVVRVSDPISRFIGKTVSKPARARIEGEQGGFRKAPKLGLKKLLKKIKNTWLVPDETILWAIHAAWVGQKLVKQDQLDCIYTTSGPNSCHIIGLIIHLMSGVKWVADFRDPWVGNQHFRHRGMRRWFETWLERKVFQHADSVVTVSNGFKELFEDKYPQCKERIHLIRNGVDPDDFPKSTMKPFSLCPFTIFYAGILYPERSPSTFLQALSRLIRYAQVSPGTIRVQFAGVFDYPGHTENSELVKTLGLNHVVEALGYMSHDKVLRRMSEVDALLLIGERTSTAHLYIPGKLYEYLYAEKPILALLKDGEAAKLIQDVNAGIVVDPLQPEQIASAILELLRRHKGREKFASQVDLQRYTRKAQAKQLVDLINRLHV